MGAEASAVVGEGVGVTGEVGVEDRVQVQGPAVVVVEGASVAVGVPAVAAVPALQQGGARSRAAAVSASPLPTDSRNPATVYGKRYQLFGAGCA